MRAHSFFPGQAEPTLYAMAGDDLSLFFDLENLTPKQQADHDSNVVLTGLLHGALIGLGKKEDHIALFEAVGGEPWKGMMEFYFQAFQEMGLDPIPPDHWHYHPPFSYYGSVAAGTVPTEQVTLYMLSGSNSIIHGDSGAFEVSQKVNSKAHFAENAPGYGIPVPETLLTTKAGLEGGEAADFLARHPGEVMLKILGLAGARNVTSVASLDEARAYVGEYVSDSDVILQQKLPLGEWTEMTVDLFVSDDDIYISNVRQIMFANGLWVGNLIGPNVALTPAQEEILLKVGAYARSHGYCAPEGLNLGVDYFVRGDEILVTEINARWTGGLFPAVMLKRLGATDTDAIPFFDMVMEEKLPLLRDFIAAHLYRGEGAPFAIIPLGFSPFVGDDGFVNTWQMVTGDFEAFKTAKVAAMGEGALVAADSISLAL